MAVSISNRYLITKSLITWKLCSLTKAVSSGNLFSVKTVKLLFHQSKNVLLPLYKSFFVFVFFPPLILKPMKWPTFTQLVTTYKNSFGTKGQMQPEKTLHYSHCKWENVLTFTGFQIPLCAWIAGWKSLISVSIRGYHHATLWKHPRR